jgi:hypothetical protein
MMTTDIEKANEQPGIFKLVGLVLWCLKPLLTIFHFFDSDYPFGIFKLFSYIMAVSLLMEETGVPGENTDLL